MNITATPYHNYQSGLIYQPVVTANSPEQVNRPSETTPDTSSENHSISETTGGPQTHPDTTMVKGQELTREQIQLLDELEQMDTEVRRHEMAHIATGGRYITSGANFTYTRGPDGKNYAVGGEVSIDTSPVPGDPKATIQKMRQVKNAALAPAAPSSQDIRVASKATQASAKALSDLMILQAKEQAGSNENKAFGNLEKAAGSYEKVRLLPEGDTSSFKIAV